MIKEQLIPVLKLSAMLEVCELKLAMRSFRTSVRLEDYAQAVVVNKLEINESQEESQIQTGKIVDVNYFENKSLFTVSLCKPLIKTIWSLFLRKRVE